MSDSFDHARRFFDAAADLLNLSQNMRTLLLTPRREMKVQVAIERDNGEIPPRLLDIEFSTKRPRPHERRNCGFTPMSISRRF